MKTRRPLEQVQKPRRHTYALPTAQPGPVMADMLLHTSQLSLAIPLYVSAISAVTSAIANHPTTIAVLEAVVEHHCMGAGAFEKLCMLTSPGAHPEGTLWAG